MWRDDKRASRITDNIGEYSDYVERNVAQRALPVEHARLVHFPKRPAKFRRFYRKKKFRTVPLRAAEMCR